MDAMITVADGFQYSVNIGYDLNRDDKLKNFIPTRSSLDLLKDILLSTEISSSERARVLVGAYGKGKSHIVLTIMSILMQKDWDLFTKLQEKIDKNPELKQLIENYYDSNRIFLPVVISGTNTSVTQAFLVALQKTLSENDLSDVMPETNYQAAINVVDRWKKEFPETLERFVEEIGRPADVFTKELEDYDIKAYEEFEKIYPKLTSGSVFNPFLGFDVVELYENVVKSLKNRGYAGIYVIYDEFSKFLESNIKSASVSDTKMLQDFAEKCNRSGEDQLHLLLISHKEIANYIDKLPKEKVDGWRGVSERFKHIHLNNNFTQTYEIISSVIQKHPENGWDEYKNEKERNFRGLKDLYTSHSIFSECNENEVEKIIYGCFPLHPVSTFILPRLSERVAQNERTLFTFLSAKGKSTLSAFLDNHTEENEFRVITPDLIYDYFEPLFKKESLASELHKNYILAADILAKLEEGSLEAKIIKTLALIYILEQFEKIKPTAHELDAIYSIHGYTHEQIQNAIDNLVNKEYVIYLKVSNDFLRMKQSSGVDVLQKITDTIERQRDDVTVKSTLNNSSIDNYMYPSRYNDEKEMIRYFAFEFIDSDEITKDIDWEKKSEEIPADGVIYGIIPKDEESIAKVRKILIKTSKQSQRFVFILPRKHVDVSDVVYKFNAVMKLREEAEGDDILFDEYEVIYEDLRDVISEFISGYTHPENYKAQYIYYGKEVSVSRKASLTEILSKACFDVYGNTPVINNEAINKTELTGVAANSRNKIVSALLRNTLEPGLGLTGTGQEVSIMRSTLVRTKILVEDSGVVSVNLHTGNAEMDYMLKVISDFISDAQSSGRVEFDDLYKRLVSHEVGIGLRKGLIPIYIAAVFHTRSRDIAILHGDVQLPLNLDTLLKIEAQPASYSLAYLDWDPEKEAYIRELETIFSDYVVEAEKALNAYDYVISAMRRWYMSLPKYSKELRPSGSASRYKGLVKLLKNEQGSYDLLFEKLGAEFGCDEFSVVIADSVARAKEYYDNAIDKLIDELVVTVKETITGKDIANIPKRSSLTSIIKDWCEKLDPSVFEQLFDNGAEKCLGLFKEVTNDEKSFVLRLAKLITGLRIEDWDKNTIVPFKERLKEYKLTAENFVAGTENSDETITSEYSLSFKDAKGNTVVKRFEKVEETGRGNLLKNNLLSDIDSMGQSISEQEKRQILMEVLKSLC